MAKRDFRLDEEEVRGLLAAATSAAGGPAVETILERAGEGNGLEPTELATLWLSSIDSERMYSLAQH